MRRRLRDHYADCPVWITPDGDRVILLPPGQGEVIAAHAAHAVRRPEGVYFGISQETLAHLVIAAITEDSMNERQMSLLHRLTTDEEWRAAEAAAEMAEAAAGVAGG